MATTKYKVSKYSIMIDSVKILRETEKSIFTVGHNGRTNQERKESTSYQWFDTWEDAHNFLVKRTETAIETYEKILNGIRDNLAELKETIKPEEE